MSDHGELKRLAILAKNWSSEIGENEWYTSCCFDKPKFSVPDAEFIAKCEPGSVLALIAEVEGLRAQHGRDSAELRSLCQARDDARKERDQLKAEIEALRNLARELRGSAECTNVHHCKSEQHDLDEPCKVLARIDAAMTKGDHP